MQIWAHTLVKNEERYIWYAIMSVIDYIDKVMVWDTGSTDGTMKIVESIKKRYPEKIELKECGEVTPEKYTVLRQKMLDRTNSDWFMILDGDEVWWDDSIRKVTEFVRKKGKGYDTIVNPYFNIVGDIYHFQEEAAGMYKIGKRKGHINVRFINRRIPGLYTTRPHGQHGYFDGKDLIIQERDAKKRIFLDAPYMHFTNMVRSSSREMDLNVPKRKGKLKYEIGDRFPLDFFYPEVFFQPSVKIIHSPWLRNSAKYKIVAAIETPLRRFKRRFAFFEKSGY